MNPILKLIGLVCLAGMLLGCQPNAAEFPPDVFPETEQNADGLAQHCFDSVVRIRNREGTGCGNAIAYFNGGQPVDSINEATHVEFETNHHVALDRGNRNVIDVWNHGDLVASEATQTTDSWFENRLGKDIAILRVPVAQLGGPVPIVPPTPYKKAFLETGSMVFSIGCSDARHPRARCGNVIKIENGLIYSTPVSIGGDSGGPLIAWSADRKRFETTGRTAWAIKTEIGWVCLSMTSDRIHDIRSGRVSDADWSLPEGAIPLKDLKHIKSCIALPDGAIRCDELGPGCNICDENQTPTKADPQPLEVIRRPGWVFPLPGEAPSESGRGSVRERRGLFPAIRFAFSGGYWLLQRIARLSMLALVLFLLVSLWVGPTMLTPLKYDWPLTAIPIVWKKLRSLFPLILILLLLPSLAQAQETVCENGVCRVLAPPAAIESATAKTTELPVLSNDSPAAVVPLPMPAIEPRPLVIEPVPNYQSRPANLFRFRPIRNLFCRFGRRR